MELERRTMPVLVDISFRVPPSLVEGHSVLWLGIPVCGFYLRYIPVARLKCESCSKTLKRGRLARHVCFGRGRERSELHTGIAQPSSLPSLPPLLSAYPVSSSTYSLIIWLLLAGTCPQPSSALTLSTPYQAKQPYRLLQAHSDMF